MMEYDLVTEASKKVGVEPHVLRYWEDELKLDIPRNDLGHRYYTEYHIRLLRQIKELKEQGYQLKAVKNVLNKMAGVMDDILITEEDMEGDMAVKGSRKQNYGGNGKKKGKALKSPYNDDRLFQAALEADVRANLRELAEMGKQEQETVSISEEEEAGQMEIAAGSAEILSEETNAPLKTEEALPDKEEPLNTEGAEILSISRERRERYGENEETALVSALPSDEEKMTQFQEIMNHIIGQAMEANVERISKEITDEVSDTVTDRVLQEVEYLLRISDEKEEERFKQLDETIRVYQRQNRSRAEAAAAKLPFFKKKKFARSGRKLF